MDEEKHFIVDMRENSQRHLGESRLNMTSRMNWPMRGGRRRAMEEVKREGDKRRSRGQKELREPVTKIAGLYRKEKLGEGKGRGAEGWGSSG